MWHKRFATLTQSKDGRQLPCFLCSNPRTTRPAAQSEAAHADIAMGKCTVEKIIEAASSPLDPMRQTSSIPRTGGFENALREFLLDGCSRLYIMQPHRKG